MSDPEAPEAIHPIAASSPLPAQHLEQVSAEPDESPSPTVILEVEPIEKGRPPPPSIRTNIERLLEEDSTRLGDAYRGNRDNRTPVEIASELGIDSVG